MTDNRPTIVALRKLDRISNEYKNELDLLAQFKLGNPKIIDNLGEALGDAIVQKVPCAKWSSVIVTGAPAGESFSAARYLVLRVAKFLRCSIVFPEKLRSAAGYSLLKTYRDRSRQLEGQFQFAAKLSHRLVIAIDDVISTGAMCDELSLQIERAEGSIVAFAVVWDFHDTCQTVEKEIRQYMVDYVSEHKEQILRCTDWCHTTALTKVLQVVFDN